MVVVLEGTHVGGEAVRHGSKPGSHRGANGGASPLPAGQQWAGHVGRRARYRLLRQRWARIEKLCATDLEAQAA